MSGHARPAWPSQLGHALVPTHDHTCTPPVSSTPAGTPPEPGAQMRWMFVVVSLIVQRFDSFSTL